VGIVAVNSSDTSRVPKIDLDACENFNRLRRVMIRCTHSNAVSILVLVGVVFPLAGCDMVNLRAARANKEEQPNGAPVTLDDMILKSIRRNVSNVDAQMTPNEAVAVLGIQGFGLRDGYAASEDEIVYEFSGVGSKVIIRSKNVGWISSGSDPHEKVITTIITSVVFARSDSTRTRFAVGDSR
jgi:hypothetical protein